MIHPKSWMVFGALLAGLAVAFGAFGAHGLRGKLESQGVDPFEISRQVDTYEVAARYQMYHGLAMILAGICSRFGANRWLAGAAWLFFAGTLIFSGLLYVLVLTQQRILGMYVPLGGLAFLLGWAFFAVGIALGKGVISAEDVPPGTADSAEPPRDPGAPGHSAQGEGPADAAE